MTMDDRIAAPEERALDRKIDAAAWGVFLVWAGVALLANVGWGVGFVGAGLITLGAQGWRRYSGVRVDRFWIVAGGLFVAVGAWNLLELHVDVVPFLFIAAGVALLVSTWRRHRASGARPGVDAPSHPRV